MIPPRLKTGTNVFFAAILAILLTQEAALAGLTGSKHDLSGKGYGTNQICIFCHAPHNADKTVTDSPLWNHQVTSATYTLYSYGSPGNSRRTPVGQPGSNSRLCLSCHDGTVALDSFGVTTGTHMIGGAANIGTDLSDDHPIGLQWNHQANDGAGCQRCHSTHIPRPPGYPLVFFDGSIECGTCHDPHNDVSNDKMLRETLTGSQICFHCHVLK